MRYITYRKHDEDKSLVIANYTPACVYDQAWTEETLSSRGKITRNGEVVARGMNKFFNWGEMAQDAFDLDQPAYAFDKVDGSLGIPYEAPDGRTAVATRGSFHSEQAEWATAFIRENHPDYSARTDGYTDVFEIVYPENRIVLDYGDKQGLVFLGTVDNKTGFLNPLATAPDGFEKTQHIAQGTLRDCLSLPTRKNAEGVVIFLPERTDGTLIKVKQEDYVKLHRIVTGLTKKRVYELCANQEAVVTRREIPEEFRGFFDKHAQDADDEYYLRRRVVECVFHNLQGVADRRTFAWYVKEEEPWLRAALFARLDDRPHQVDEIIWKEIIANV